MHRFWYNKIFRSPENGNGGGGGSPPPQNNNNNNNGSGNNNRGDGSGNNNNNNNNNNGDEGNNGSDFDLTRDNIWSLPEGGNDDTNRNNNNSRREPQSGAEANERNNDATVMSNFQKYVDQKNFKFELSPEAIKGFVETGDYKGLNEALQTQSRDVYKQVLLDASKMVNSAIDKALAKAQENTNSTLNVTRAKETLQRIVPISKNPNVAPIAEAIMAQTLKANPKLSHEEAATKVSKVLAAMRNVQSKDLGIDEPPSNRNNRRGSPSQQDDEEMIDWMSFADS